MSKNGNSIRLTGKKHSIPRCFVRFLDDLESLSCVECVSTLKWTRKKSPHEVQRNQIKYYDETTRTFRIRVCYDGYIQLFGVRVKPGLKDEFEDYMENYQN